MRKSLDRRVFFKGCLTAASMVVSNPGLLVHADNRIKRYSKVLLTHQNGQPVTSDMLVTQQCYVFHYPFVTTPCFLINTGLPLSGPEPLLTEAGDRYEWPGGTGPEKSVVAFSAICAHKLSYPTRSISFINYRSKHVLSEQQGQAGQAARQLIYCCSERSAYDPLKGAKVLSGPAPEPLTTIALEFDQDNDHFYAVGTQGTEHYDRFFERFGFNLALENQIDDIRETVTGAATIYKSDEYSKHLQSC